MTRIAHCCCGSLRAEATGAPAFVVACHCTECQRRTGSPFGVSTYFPKEQVRTEGRSNVYVRGSDSGRKLEFHVCPDCGSTVYWYAEALPGLIGIGFGTFADPSMPWPTLSVWKQTRHPWVAFDHQLDRFTVQPKIDDLDLGLPNPPSSERSQWQSLRVRPVVEPMPDQIERAADDRNRRIRCDP
jgi:hypothetical protein